MNAMKMLSMAPKVIGAIENKDLAKLAAIFLPMLTDEDIQGMAAKLLGYWMDQQKKVPGFQYRLTLEPTPDNSNIVFNIWLYALSDKSFSIHKSIPLSSLDKAQIQAFVDSLVSSMNQNDNEQKSLPDAHVL